jgi:hypothetical protein
MGDQKTTLANQENTVVGMKEKKQYSDQSRLEKKLFGFQRFAVRSEDPPHPR